MQNIHGLFKHFYTIHKEALTEKKKERVSTNTMHYDKSGNGHILCNAIFKFVQPTPEIWMLSGLQKQNWPLYTVEHSAYLFYVVLTISPQQRPDTACVI